MTDRSVAPGTLIMFGQPDQETLAARLEYLGTLPERVVMIDPQADAVLPDQPGVERIHAFVSDAAGEADLNLYSVAGLRSFTAPTPALTALFPRLRVNETLPVQLITADELAKRLGQLSSPLHLWIDMSGQKRDLLANLQSAGVLDNAATLTIRCGVESFFEGADDSAAVRSWLGQAGFDLAGVDDRDPDWPDMKFRRNPLALQLRELKKINASQEEELNEIRRELKERERDKALLITQRTELQAQVARLTGDLKAALASLKAIGEKTEKPQQEALDQLTEVRAELAEVRAELSARERDKALLVTQRSDLRERVAKLEGGLKAAEAKAETARSDLTFQMRLKEMQKLDLDNLRQRFEDSEQRRRQQEELFLKLTPRLSQASEQLRQLQLAADPTFALSEEESAAPVAQHEAAPKKTSVKKTRGKASSKSSKKG
ncbi:hypothetical protein [Thalassovita mangrovi]|uniref:Uncharacterized protein n=1 Tax=Thalassovita mangrovi TaxID=2692236 RepID=A0A6L8LQR4_9RHOB|nr:hypothetical protein [Thalassovita mangrovi]MYM55852.1 hypothetical protein [Thalassovita mangrovi]